MGTQGMEYDASTGKVVWISYYYEEKSWGNWDYTYLYEIDPTTNTYIMHNDMSHQLVALLIPQEGKSGNWADPTNEIMSFELPGERMNLLRGYATRLAVDMLPWNVSNRDIVWSSADPTIAEVNQYGLVTGLKLGTTTITATSVLDPTVSDTITVDVTTMPVTLEGVLLDEESNPVQFSWNLMETETWTAGMALDAVLLSATKTANGDLLGLDSSARTVLRVDATTGTSVELGTWDGQIYDMVYSKLFSDETTDRVHMIVDSMWLPAKDPANPLDTEGWDLFDYIFDNAYAFEFVAIAVGDVVTLEDQGNTYEAEELYLLDDMGYIWKLCAYFDGEFYNSTEPVCYSSNLKDLGWSATRLDETVLTLSSMVMGDDGNLYLSAYTGITSDFYQLDLNEETKTCEAVLFANSGDEVWPAILLEVTSQEPLCGHTNTELRNAAEGSCTEEGYTGDTYCLDCGELVTEGQVIPAGHTGEASVVKAPTTATTGKLALLCDRCGEKQSVVLPALSTADYSYEEILAPTATSDGIGRYIWNETTYGSFSFRAVVGHEVAETDAQIVIDSKSAQAGNIFRLEVMLKNNPGVQAILGQLQYDASVLTLVKVENGTVLADLDTGCNLLWTTDANSVEDGVLCVLEFQVAENAPVGNYPVALILEEAVNENEETVQLHMVFGTVSVNEVLYGDVNGDGKISLTDVVRLRRYLANRDLATGVSPVIVEDGADVDGDGKITLDDALRLRKYLANRDPATGESSVELGPQ